MFEKVLDRAHGALVVSIREAIDTELSDERELREALIAFAIRVVTEAFPSADYVAFRRLTTQQRTLPPLPERTANQPERMLKERFAEMIRDARIAQSDPGVAAAHFTALTIRLALDELNADPTEPVERSDIISIIGNGVDAFLRAYGR